MKTKLLTLALFAFLTVGFVACAEEEIAPSDDVTEVSTRRGDNGTSIPIPERD